MSFVEFLLWKAAVLCVLAFAWNFYLGFTGSRR